PTYIASPATARVTIIDDDLITVTIFPTSATAAEPSSTGRFTVMRAGDLSGNLLVNYNVSGTASNGIDYTSLSGSLIIPAGLTSTNITITPLDDSLLEGDESVIISLANNPGYNVGSPGSATLFIRDDEKVTVSITATDSSASEPGSDTGLFTISRGSILNGNLTVNFAISGTAINGVDYIPIDNFAVIPDGASEVTIEVIPFDDLYLEYTETVMLNLIASTNYNLGSANRATVNILDDDANSIPAVGFTFTTSSAPESDSPGVSVSLSATSTIPISVDYRIIGGTASSNDYTFTPGTLTFDPGEWSKSIPLTIINDSILESNETIRLVLNNPVGATLDGNKIHTYTILDDDSASVTVVATAPTASETGPLPGNFRFSRVGNLTTNLVVNFQVTGTASAPSDYAPIGTSVTIPAGAAFVDLQVVPVNDATVEIGETVVVTLTSAAGAKLISPSVATVTIVDNDLETLPVVSVTSTVKPIALEGSANNGEFVFTRSGSSSGALTIYFTISGTASNGVDYAQITNIVTIPDGQTFATISITPLDDTLVEGDETVLVNLTVRDTYRVLFPASALVTIQDNDQSVRVDASDFEAAEPGTNRGEFTFTRFGTTNSDLTIFFNVSGTAINGLDYVAISNSIIIRSNQLFATLPIVPLDDFLREGPETVKVTLLSGSNYSFSSPTNATVTILDDEPMVSLVGTITNASENGRQPGVITLIRTGDTNVDFVVNLAVNGTATYGVDYPPFATNVLFCCGASSIDVTIYPTNDLLIENLETVAVSILPSADYTIFSPSNVVVTIEDVGTKQFPVVIITSPSARTVFLSGTNINMILEATVTDNDPAAPLTLTWSKQSGPDTFAFSDPLATNTTVNFSGSGVYVLRLTADDGVLQSFGEVTVVVNLGESLAPDLLHWKFDDGSGTTALDSSGAGHNGVLVGTPGWVANGMVGGALSFGGINDFVRETSGTNFLNGLGAMSLSLWIKSNTTNSDRGFISTDNSGGTNTTLDLSAKTYDAFSHRTNVIAVTIPTTNGVSRYISANNVTTNDWQHVVLTWRNTNGAALFINGQLDTPSFRSPGFAGVLTNCLQFIAGKGSAGNSWNGLLDDIRIYSRALNVGEITALHALPPTNFAPVVDVGPDFTVQIATSATLNGLVSDDGNPNPPGALNNLWSFISGPVPITFTNAGSLTNTIQFNDAGSYLFRLTSTDGQVKIFDEVTVTVTEPTSIYLYASDSEAAELGPDLGQFTIQRFGDINFDLTIQMTMSGTASNGVDFVALTNSVTIPAGTNLTTFYVTPFLDNRTEGDESVVFNVITNSGYTIGSATATVTIHDSPYGIWTINHFTLEELTDPNLSGEGADFDRDGLVNFNEYAFHREPKSTETSSVITTAIEFNPVDGQYHITFIYQRLIPPVDVRYAVYVSNDLFTWNTGINYIEELQVTNDGNGLTETVKARVKAPYTLLNNQFITIRTSRPQQ
ncbi:MAG: hypothetical protein M3Y82_15300, partial [Verrucomicrobiota bacterium]|nr:hypothetical protein [Verrucomicrobiota bacterium]